MAAASLPSRADWVPADWGLADSIDLARYPIDDLEGPGGQALVARCRDELRDDGCCHLPGFMTAPAVARSAAMAEALEPQTFRSTMRHNVYASADDPSLPADHPVRHFQSRTQGFICADLLDPDSDLCRLYDSEAVTAFLSACLEIAPIYRSADPVACMPISVQRPGELFPWHFDGNEFTITIALQGAEGGGVFEYVPGIRSPADENFEGVRRVLEGDPTLVRRLSLKAGDLQIFLGRFSMHRVTAVEGARTRFIAAPAWMRVPNYVNTVERSIDGYGRATELHHRRAASHDGLRE